MLNASLDGLLTGLSLIVAIGAQNAYVLRQGLRRAYVGPVVAVCTVSDFALIVAGVSRDRRDRAARRVGAAGGALVRGRVPRLVRAVVGVAGAAARVLAERGARRPGPRARGACAATMALTWLNPHVYLDTVVLLGSIANAHGSVGAVVVRRRRVRGEHAVVHRPRLRRPVRRRAARDAARLAGPRPAHRGDDARASPSSSRRASRRLARPRRRGRGGSPRPGARRAGCPAARAWRRGCRRRSPRSGTSPPGRPRGRASPPAGRPA